MITAKNLKKSGFIPGEKMPLEDGGWYRDWGLTIRPFLSIVVCELYDGTFTSELVCKEDITLNLTSVTDLLTLAKLLK